MPIKDCQKSNDALFHDGPCCPSRRKAAQIVEHIEAKTSPDDVPVPEVSRTSFSQSLDDVDEPRYRNCRLCWPGLRRLMMLKLALDLYTLG